MRVALIFAAALVAGLVCAAGASAGKPTMSPAGNVDYVDDTCGFPVAVHVVVDKEQVKEYDSGKVLVNGSTRPYSATGRRRSL